jgi:tetratricopeptide (TPR) repeat protein
MERAYRYCRALEDRPGAPADWGRALELLDRLGDRWSIRAFAPLRDRLAAKLKATAIPRGTAPAPAWLDEHLLGFAAESEPGSGAAEARGRDDPRLAIERALRHYDRVLTIRPGSFWGHYRAAAACFGLGRLAEAANHLARCLELRPGNISVQAQFAACLFALDQYSGALEVCDRALEQAPTCALLYQTRAYARVESRQTGGLEDDLRHYEMYSRILPRSFWDVAEPANPRKEAGPIEWAFTGPLDIRRGLARRQGVDEAIEVDPEGIYGRIMLAKFLHEAEESSLARVEIEKILVIQPDHIPARLLRAEQAIADRRFDAARAELDAVLGHPGLEDHLLGNGDALDPFLEVTELYLKAGRLGEARMIAERARDLAIQFRPGAGGPYYNLAQVYAVLGASDPPLIEEAAQQLFQAFLAHPDFLKRYRKQSPWFDPVRTRIDAALARMEDPMEVHRRGEAGSSAKAPTRVAER